MAYLLHLIDGNRDVEVDAGSNLLEVLRSCGCAPDAPCGGQGRCGKCAVVVDGQEQLACRYTIEGDIAVRVPENAPTAILTEGAALGVPVDPARPGHLCAVDIGTTTVVCYLLDPTGVRLATTSTLNPQEPFGADVISRIQAARGGELEALTTAIRDGVSGLVESACREADITPLDIGLISVVGNPCMQQLFFGLPVDNLATIPFTPLLTHGAIVPAGPLVRPLRNASLLTVGDISGFVGADTMACVLATRLFEADDVALIVDIGTNGEMVLSDHGRMVACSTAAGPALEGANISQGMRGANGAIDHVDESGVSVIGGGEAVGICGSGLVDAVALMLRSGVMDEHGRIHTSDSAYHLTDTVTITQEDIRALQLAKGAIAAGIKLMAADRGFDVAAIDRCILAGAFGSYLNPESACEIGLLPAELSGKIIAGGNLAGSGAMMLSLDQAQLALTDQLLGTIEFLELAALDEFEWTFAESMLF